MSLDLSEKERMRQSRSKWMISAWKSGKIRKKTPWNKGKSTRLLGVAREVKTKIEYICKECGISFIDWRASKRIFCSKKCLAKSNSRKNKGEQSCHWKGGITPEFNKIRSSIEYKSWVQAVFARDGYTCQKTGVKGGRLVAHHIKNFSKYKELRIDIDNGITLSVESHEEFHKIYGKKNNNFEQLIEYLKKC